MILINTFQKKLNFVRDYMVFLSHLPCAASPQQTEDLGMPTSIATGSKFWCSTKIVQQTLNIYIYQIKSEYLQKIQVFHIAATATARRIVTAGVNETTVPPQIMEVILTLGVPILIEIS